MKIADILGLRQRGERAHVNVNGFSTSPPTSSFHGLDGDVRALGEIPSRANSSLRAVPAGLRPANSTLTAPCRGRSAAGYISDGVDEVVLMGSGSERSFHRSMSGTAHERS